MSRWSELMKQPKAKIVTVTNQLDEYDGKGKKFLISDRVTPSFESFVTDVNDKLAPPGVALRNIYTAQHGHKVRWDKWTEIYNIHYICMYKWFVHRQILQVCERPDCQQAVHCQPQEV